MIKNSNFAKNLISLMSPKSPYKPKNSELLEKLNKKKGLSYSDIGKVAGVSPQAVDNWLKKDIQPRQKHIQKIAEAFGVSESWLLGYDNAAVHDDSSKYAPFEKYGFSYRAWKALDDAKNYYENKGYTPEEVTSNMRELLNGLNIILELSQENGFNVRTYKTDTRLNSKTYLPIIGIIADLFSLNYFPKYIFEDVHFEWLTDKIILTKYSKLEDLKKVLTKNIQVGCIPFNAIETDLNNLSQISEILKTYKLIKVKEELKSLTAEITKEKNVNIDIPLPEEILLELDIETDYKYKTLQTLYNFYSGKV